MFHRHTRKVKGINRYIDINIDIDIDLDIDQVLISPQIQLEVHKDIRNQKKSLLIFFFLDPSEVIWNVFRSLLPHQKDTSMN